MSTSKPGQRSDAAVNRERLVDAARQLFARQGHDVPLDEIARAAGVSRTTLYRNFGGREDLAALVYEDNVRHIEERAITLRDDPHGTRKLLDEILTLQETNRSLSQVLSQSDPSRLEALSARTAAALAPLVENGLRVGTVRSDVDLDDVMLAFPMADGVFDEVRSPTAGDHSRRLREMLHRALFTSD